MAMAPCFKSGGFDFHSDWNLASTLYALLPYFGFSDPILVGRGPVGVGKESHYSFKILPRVKWDGDGHIILPNDKLSGGGKDASK